MIIVECRIGGSQGSAVNLQLSKDRKTKKRADFYNEIRASLPGYKKVQDDDFEVGYLTIDDDDDEESIRVIEPQA